MKKKRRSINDEVIRSMFKAVHGDKYDYSKVEYKTMHTKVTIICKEHGDFQQEPNSHYRGRGCVKCGLAKQVLRQKDTTTEFVRKVKEVHGEKYDYSKIEYGDNAHDPVILVCHVHGEFTATPNALLSKKAGCAACAVVARSSNTEEFVAKSKAMHGDTYDYTKVKYVNGLTKVEIGCPHHGSYKQAPSNHLTGQGCPICGKILYQLCRGYEKDIEVSKTVASGVYLLHFPEEGFYKIGISKDLNPRVRRIENYTGYTIDTVRYIETDLFQAFEIERYILRQYKKYKYRPKVKFHGHTECFSSELPVEEVIEYIKSNKHGTK